MDKNTFDELKAWFQDYVATFRCEQDEDQRNIDLKIDHTHRVCQEIVSLAREQGLNEEQICLAETIALFHDIGRFEQYKKYKSYCDLATEDHAQLGIKVLTTNGTLDHVEPSLKQLILCAIANHNRAVIPDGISSDCLLFTKLLRDADKLDIWKVVTDYYKAIDQMPNAVIELNLPNSPGISDKVYDDIMAQKIVKKEHIINLNDFKLLQIGWIFDINFSSTFRKVKERKYVEQLLATLPALEQTPRISSHVLAFLEKMSLSS